VLGGTIGLKSYLMWRKTHNITVRIAVMNWIMNLRTSSTMFLLSALS